MLDNILEIRLEEYYGEEPTLVAETIFNIKEKWFMFTPIYSVRKWQGIKMPFSDDPSNDPKLESLLQKLLEWDDEYFQPVLHGSSWKFHIRYIDDKVIFKQGSNEWPANWDEVKRLIDAILNLNISRQKIIT